WKPGDLVMMLAFVLTTAISQHCVALTWGYAWRLARRSEGVVRDIADFERAIKVEEAKKQFDDVRNAFLYDRRIDHAKQMKHDIVHAYLKECPHTSMGRFLRVGIAP